LQRTVVFPHSNEPNTSQQNISSSSAVTTSSISSSTKTAAQLRFEEAQAKRLHERAKKEAVKSHREKIEDLNKLLETMPEHYDLFRISYGGQG
jgi:protein FAM32A